MKHRLRGRNGFTLAELLMVVGIMAILSAVSFPALIHMRNSLRQTELDEKARQIFITAQNCLSGFRLSGAVLEVPPRGTDGLELADDMVPSDFQEGDGEMPDTYALCDGEAGSFSWMNDTVFAPALVKEDGGSYVIEFNRQTNVVYGVYYWERNGGAFQKASLFHYHENFNEYDGKPLRGEENRNNRMLPSVGYYGGETAAAAQDRKDVDFQVSIYNEERLKATVSMPSSLYEEAVFEVTISSKTDSANPVRYRFRLYNGAVTVLEPEDPFHQMAEIWKVIPATGGEMSASYVLTLDSLEEGLHFADHFSEIAAGDDLRISVMGYCVGSDAVYIPRTKTAEINSLFAGLRGGDGTGSDIWVENGRHLQNLSYEVSGLGYSTDGASERKTGYPVMCARVLEEIDWMEPVYDGLSYDDVCTARRDSTLSGPVHFYPISNNKTDLQSFQGNSYEIKGIHVTQEASVADEGGTVYGCAGLFGYMEGRPGGNDSSRDSGNQETAGAAPVIQDVMLVNPSLKLTGPAVSYGGGSYAGSLVGYADQMEINNCGAYIDSDDAESDFSALYKESGITSECDYGGGLIGGARDLTARDSFASVRVSAERIAGGFIGTVNGSLNISTCYSGGHTESGAYRADRPNVEAAEAAGGFAGELNGSGLIEKSFSACSVSALQCGPFAGIPDVGTGAVTFEATYGVGSTLIKGSGGEPNPIGCGSTGEALAKGARKAERKNTSPYDDAYRKDTNAAYLYPIWLEVYRGDWAKSSFTGLVYYEKYETTDSGQDAFGFWYPGAEENGTLRDDLPVISDGYGYLSDTVRSVKLFQNGIPHASNKSEEHGKENWNKNEITLSPVQVEGKNQVLYPFPWIHVTEKRFDAFKSPGNRKNSFYDTLALTVDGAALTAFYNPHFAKTIVFTEEEAATNPKYAVIRTARHLYELGDKGNGGKKSNSYYWQAEWDYNQERDLDYEKYKAGETYPDTENAPETLSQGVIGSGKTGTFQKSYSGNGHRISNLILTDDSVSTGMASGMALFGYTAEKSHLNGMVLYRPQVVTHSLLSVAGLVYTNGGSVTEAALISPVISGIGSEGCGAAGLVYENINGALIEDCYVIPEQSDGWEDDLSEDPLRYKHLYGNDGKVTGNNYTNAMVAASGSAAGLVGQNYGSIKRCAAIATVTATDIEAGDAAGFVSMNRGSGLIEKSYANCYTAGQEAAGFVYETSGSSSINSCYALRRVTATSVSGIAAGFSVKDKAKTITNCYAAVSNGFSNAYQAVTGGLILYPDCQYADSEVYGASFYPFSAGIQNNCFYMDWTENRGDGKIGNAMAVTYGDLKKLSIPGLEPASQTGKDTVTFSLMLPGVYPFPKVENMIQYGDWPNYEYVGAELAYFEIYKEDSGYTVGFYNEELGLDSLRDGKKIFLDGYGLLFNTEYLEMDGVNVKNLIQGSSTSNDKAYLSWEDRNGNDNTTANATNYLKSVYHLKDNNGKKIEKGVSYYKNTESGASAIRSGAGDGYPDQPIELKLNNRPGTYYFRILPPAAVVTNAYVPSDSIYQQIMIHVESNYYDEMGGIGTGIIEKNREFYYCPHFAKSRISTDGKPEESENPEYLCIRTSRQLCTLSSGNQVLGGRGEGLENYYGKSFRQEQDINLGPQNPYAVYYSDTAPFSEERGRSGYRWFNSSIGTSQTPFEGMYDGGGYTIKGLGAWDSRSSISGQSVFDRVTANRDVPLFGYLNGAAVKELVVEGATMSERSDSLRGILCREAQKSTVIEHVTISKARLELQNFAPGTEGFGLLAGKLSGSTIKNCTVNASAVVCGSAAVKYIGGAVGHLTDGGTIDGLTLDEVSVGGSKATHLGGAAGFADSGQIRSVSVGGNGTEAVVIEGDRAVGGLIGQINSGKGAVTVGNISMTGRITVRQTTASNNTKLYNGVGLLAGLCEISGNPVTIDGIRAQGTDGSLLVENSAASQYHIGSFVVGSLYRSSGDAVACALTLGDIGIHGANLMSANPGRSNTYCGYGGLIGQNSKAVVLAAGSPWDLGSSSISVTAEAGANGYHSDSGVSGLTGKFLEAASMTLPEETILPDIRVRVQAGGSIPVSGVANVTAGRVVAIEAAEQAGSRVRIHSIVTENCRNTGGLTAVLSDDTVFHKLSVERVMTDGSAPGPGVIEASGNVGGIAGTVACGPSNVVKQLSVNGLQIRGSGNVGGFAGVVTGGIIEQCSAYADVAVVWPADSMAGGFAGKIENGSMLRCYASGSVSASGGEGSTAVLKAGGFFGDISSSGRLESCYASGNASLKAGNAASGSALGGFGGSISSNRGSQVIVTKCYSVGAVAVEQENSGETGGSSSVKAGGFIGHLVKGRDVFDVSDDLIRNLIRMMKGAEVHNRITSQNGKTVWELNVGMDSETRGIFDNSNISALVYNVLGYPAYPDLLKTGRENTNGKAPDEEIKKAYEMVFDSADQLVPDSAPGSEESYYHTFFEKAQDNAVMTMWAVNRSGNTRYLYWINEQKPEEGVTYTGYRVNLDAYDSALTEDYSGTARRQSLFETKQVRVSRKTDGSYDGKMYLYLADLEGAWQFLEEAAVADCYFLRGTGSDGGAINAEYGPVENYIEPWSVEEFSLEMTREIRDSQNAVLTGMQPDPENMEPGFAGYPFPMLEGAGAGGDGRTHTGLWPAGYQPYYKLTD